MTNLKKEIEESYISKVGKMRTIFIRKGYYDDGYVRVVKLSQKDLDKVMKLEANKLAEEVKELKEKQKLQKHINKLRELRKERNVF